jgi:hypothetical protein
MNSVFFCSYYIFLFLIFLSFVTKKEEKEKKPTFKLALFHKNDALGVNKE